MSQEGLKKLMVWSKARELAHLVYQDVVRVLPQEEKWSLGQQLRRAVLSIPANIAEGYGRYYYLENVRFCYIARGSLEETINYVILAHDLGYIPTDTLTRISFQVDALQQLLNGYITYLKRERKGSNETGQTNTIHEELSLYEFDLNGPFAHEPPENENET